ncbi:MAG: META domain-containing protein [Cognatishimia sp.]|uniref:META domain-containing protein n=1 Tax=Cognatishimia sp. TaxID=2211648 RepID=UPI003B8B0EF6
MRLLAILLLINACVRDETLTAYGADGSWKLHQLNGQPFSATATIRFSEDGQIDGDAPCNAYSAVQTAPYPWFELGPILSTKRACAALGVEQTYFAMLTEMTLAEVSGNVLILSNDADQTLLFTKLPDG